ncbi:macro domain-containing protein [Actinoplanes sp. NPDC049802]|uniref:macro domain-containing protein n=1 Tax=Actinoplanes sp. NPDC049802 TaxID=3154742 RepID=UPI0033D70B70
MTRPLWGEPMTRQALRIWTTQSFATFGVFALLLQSYQAIWDRAAFPGFAGQVTAAVAVASIGFGLYRTRPGRSVARDLRTPRCRVEVVPGDLFDQEDFHLVIGFTDVFDTDPGDSRIVNEQSVQAQLLRRVYDAELDRLDADLATALAGVPVRETVSRADKTLGKLDRYPLGTVAVLGTARRHFFCLAYSSMSAGLTARSSVDILWHSLSRLWEAVDEHGQRRPLAMPLIGAALARVDTLDRRSLLRLILLSFVAASRERVRTTHLRIVVPPAEFEEIDRLELQAFVDSL